MEKINNDRDTNESDAEIMQQYEYDERLQGILREIVPEITEYYGDRELVNEALRKCPIFMLESDEDSNEKVNNYFDEEVSIPTIASEAAVIVPRVNNEGNVEKLTAWGQE